MKWVDVRIRAETLKVDVSSFRQMRREKVLPPHLGRIHREESELEPFTATEN